MTQPYIFEVVGPSPFLFLFPQKTNYVGHFGDPVKIPGDGVEKERGKTMN